MTSCGMKNGWKGDLNGAREGVKGGGEKDE